MKRYLLFASHSYAYAILRPIEAEIWRRGDEAAWLLEDTCPDWLTTEEHRLRTLREAIAYQPVAVFVPGNYVYDFLPGVKVEVFHGYPIDKRRQKRDIMHTHFRLRGWFDVYCTQGPSSTGPFRQLEQQHRYFKVYETGWPKTDTLVTAAHAAPSVSRPPTILYAATFTRGISAAWEMPPVIEHLAQTRPWRWVMTLHPKITDEELLEQYRTLARKYNNVEFLPQVSADVMRQTDVMLCDSSSIIVEYMLLDKPVVTVRNTNPGPHLIDVPSTDKVETALCQALTRPAALMDEVRRFASWHEAHRDGRNAARVLEAVDDFIAHYQGRLPRKPFNFFRRLKLRWQLKYFRW